MGPIMHIHVTDHSFDAAQFYDAKQHKEGQKTSALKFPVDAAERKADVFSGLTETVTQNQTLGGFPAPSLLAKAYRKLL